MEGSNLEVGKGKYWQLVGLLYVCHIGTRCKRLTRAPDLGQQLIPKPKLTLILIPQTWTYKSDS